jgi:[ribosomal protein S18]-alanine N-acetyltransferase
MSGLFKPLLAARLVHDVHKRVHRGPDLDRAVPPDAFIAPEPGTPGEEIVWPMDEDCWRRDFVRSYPPPRLRGASKGDVPRIAELEKIAFGDKGMTYNDLNILFDPSGPLWLLAEDKRKVWGYSINLRGGEDPTVGWILGMAIHPRRQRRKWGQFLLQGTVDRLRAHDIEVIRLLVAPENKIARRLYELFGFIDTGERADHFGPGEPRIVMSLLPGVRGALSSGHALLPEVPADSDGLADADETTDE